MFLRTRIVCIVLLTAILSCFSAAALPASATPSVSAAGAVLIEAESGRILYEKNAHTPRGMASTTKIMTALVALEACDDLDRTVKVAREATGIEGSSVYLYPGERITLLHLLYALLLGSANDAAAAIAIEIGGSIPDFAAMMNETAAKLGLTHTHFENPHGLDADGHQTTPYELALLSAYALKNEIFRQIVSTASISIPLHDGTATRLLTNHNRLVRTDKRVYGVKTGYTRACGRCLVSAAEQDGVQVIAVTLNAPDDWNDHRALYEYGFSVLERVTLAAPGALAAQIPVTGGAEAFVNAVNTRALSITLPKGPYEMQVKYETNCFLYAPVTAGQLCGEAIVLVDGIEAGRLNLYAESAVDSKKEEEKPSFFARLIRWIVSLF